MARCVPQHTTRNPENEPLAVSTASTIARETTTSTPSTTTIRCDEPPNVASTPTTNLTAYDTPPSIPKPTTATFASETTPKATEPCLTVSFPKTCATGRPRRSSEPPIPTTSHIRAPTSPHNVPTPTVPDDQVRVH